MLTLGLVLFDTHITCDAMRGLSLPPHMVSACVCVCCSITLSTCRPYQKTWRFDLLQTVPVRGAVLLDSYGRCAYFSRLFSVSRNVRWSMTMMDDDDNDDGGSGDSGKNEDSSTQWRFLHHAKRPGIKGKSGCFEVVEWSQSA